MAAGRGGVLAGGDGVEVEWGEAGAPLLCGLQYIWPGARIAAAAESEWSREKGQGRNRRGGAARRVVRRVRACQPVDTYASGGWGEKKGALLAQQQMAAGAV